MVTFSIFQHALCKMQDYIRARKRWFFASDNQFVPSIDCAEISPPKNADKLQIFKHAIALIQREQCVR